MKKASATISKIPKTERREKQVRKILLGTRRERKTLVVIHLLEIVAVQVMEKKIKVVSTTFFWSSASNTLSRQAVRAIVEESSQTKGKRGKPLSEKSRLPGLQIHTTKIFSLRVTKQQPKKQRFSIYEKKCLLTSCSIAC